MPRPQLFLTGLLCCASAVAGTVNLTDAFVFVDGTSYQLGVADPPANVNLSAFSPSSFASPIAPFTGLGTITVSFSGAGSHNVALYYDHDINLAANGSFNEYGVKNGVVPAGFSWQLGDPNDVSANPTDIFNQAAAGNLLNRNDVGTPVAPPNICCDVAMAIGITLTLNSGDSAVLSFVTSQTQPGSGFYLSQFDVPGLTNTVPDLTPGDAVYLRAALTVRTGGGGNTPEPGTIVLLLSGLGGLAVARSRRRVV